MVPPPHAHRAQPSPRRRVVPGGRRLSVRPIPLLPTLLAAALATLALVAGGLARAAAPPAPPFGAAVLPFEDRRGGEAPSWLGAYLRERIGAALRRAPQVGVLGQDAADQWQRKLGLRPGAAVSADTLDAMGVSVVLLGSTQEVLGLAEVRLSARTAEGELLPDAAGRLRIHLAQESPAAAVQRILTLLEAALLPGGGLRERNAPADWAAAEALYTVLRTPVVPGDRAARPALVARLKPWTADPALGGRAHETLAALLLEQALLHLPPGGGRQLMLREALGHATAAYEAERLDSHRQALRALLLYLLRQDYEAKTEASIARIRNPLEPLSFVVLGLVAGLSTGEATEQFRRALAIHPFLRGAARPAGAPPYQGGALEAYFAQWDALRRERTLGRADDYARLLAEGIEHFERGEYEQAEPLLRQAAEREDNDYTPWLYLNRILIEIGHPGEAVAGLRRLAQGNPQEPELWYHLGVAQTAGGEPAAALESFRKALAERPDDPLAHYGTAVAEMALEHWPQALTALRATLHSDPDHPGAWLRLGIVHMQQEDWPAAEGALVRALELEPESQEARRRLVEVRQRLEGGTPPGTGAERAAPGAEPAQGAAPGANPAPASGAAGQN